LREDPTPWAMRLGGNLLSPQPITHLLVIVSSDKNLKLNVIGGLVFEYYRESSCGLLTYLLVKPSFRKRGLASKLIKKASKILNEDAKVEQSTLNAVFLESKNPKFPDRSLKKEKTDKNLSFLRKIGAQKVDIPYIQPQLEGGKGRCNYLSLMTIFSGKHLQVDYISGEIIKGFLYEFYQALGINKPDDDPDMIKMKKYITPRIQLRNI
jgi:GNAT superfamily N-acetyltransferase